MIYPKARPMAEAPRNGRPILARGMLVGITFHSSIEEFAVVGGTGDRWWVDGAEETEMRDPSGWWPLPGDEEN